MLESINAPRTDINVQIRGGYKSGSRGRCDIEGVSWNCTCVNCGEQFSNRKKLRYHYTKCPYLINVQQFHENDATAKDFKCSRCEKKFVDATQMANHVEKCGYRIPMHQVDSREHTFATDTAKNDPEIPETKDGIICIDDGDEPGSNIAEVVETQELNSEKCVQKIKVYADSYSVINHSEDKGNAEFVQIDKHVQDTVRIKTKHIKEEILKTHHRKRKYDVMLSTSSDPSQMVPKKIKSQEEPKIMNKLLIDDIYQEQRQNVFDRVSTDQRTYKCPKCNARFKYKHKFDIHVKFAHVQSIALFTAPDLAATKAVHKNNCNVTGLDESKCETTDTYSVSNYHHDGTIKSSSPLSENSKVIPKIGYYPCDFCHLSFRYLSRCERHIKNVHKETEDKLKFENIFRCEECQERFSDKYALLKHYNRQHMRNAKKPAVTKQTIFDQFNSILNVNDVMKHLRNNLTCLQDGKDDETGRLKDDTTKHFLDRKRSTEQLSNQSEGIIESRDSAIGREDKPEVTAYTKKSKTETAPRKKAFNAYHSYHKTRANIVKGDKIEKKELSCKEDFNMDKVRRYLHINDVLNENDKPLDLSTKDCSQNEHHTPCHSPEELSCIDKKPSDSERALLLEYYKDFLQEYGCK